MSFRTCARATLCAALGLLAAFACGHLRADFVQHKLFDNPDPGPQDFFGDSVAVSDDYVLVGAQTFGAAWGNAGQAYLFDAHSGQLLHEFDDPDLGVNDFFGRGVAISGNHLLIGAEAPGNFGGGQVHLFDADTGQLQHTFRHPSGGYNYFPSAMAIDGDYVLIGSEPGSAANVFLFDAVSGNLLHTLNGPALPAGGSYGNYIAISGTTIVVATPNDLESATIFIYDAVSGNLVDSWNDPSIHNLVAIDTDGSRILIGHDRSVDPSTDEGQALLYDLQGNLLQTYEDPNGNANWLGHYVEFAGADKILVASAAGSRGGGDVHTEALLFDAAATLLRRFDDPSPDDQFHSIAVDVNDAGDKVVMGAYSHPSDQEFPGHVLLFTNVPEPSTLALGALVLAACVRRRALKG